ncbi:MAG: ZinT/AdcA family metal-binding protein [Peptoniphilus sp.]|uniref:ZinT/AdcA family metal-binding protein n=1 Tax=Peptoniphilus sp. TaxID=1971214 RepID=UPI0025D95D51|nr:ZinT/AdcA family metal-binding protein [Peptoniphilus sp.]MCI5642618.1 ZinT/AdcA family metal-binding protein [Peptoniphilus sp.]MDD7352667.1 ZinT/AdcA family metal-binding protein [Peptoniphilaceae bacterium]MDY3902981.1 ZinT/AdcA family metal-binding protein [Peptoniphilus sp.]
MKKNFKMSLAVVLMSSALLVACNKNNSSNSTDNASPKENNTKVEQNVTAKNGEEKSQDVALSDWSGEWNSIANYIDDAGLKGAYEEVAKRDNITEEQAKKNFADHVAVDFGAMKVDEDSITFFSKPGGEEIEKANFKYVDKHPMEHGGKTLYWYEFSSNGKYPTILMMPVHGEDHMPHFHLRVGGTAEEMLAKDTWYPTFVSPTVTIDQVYEEVAE